MEKNADPEMVRKKRINSSIFSEAKAAKMSLCTTVDTSSDINDVSFEYPIYHYTSLQGLQGIISQGYFQASKSDHLNNGAETHYIDTLLNKTIAKIHENKEADKVEFITEVKAAYEYHKSAKHKKYDWYIISFSTNPDYMPIWALYANDIVYSLGFDENLFKRYRLNRTLFEELLSLDDTAYFQGKVVYSEQNQLNILNNVISNGYDLWLSTGNDKYLRNRTVDSTSYHISKLSMLFKNPHFKYEEEVRLIIEIQAKQVRINAASPQNQLKTDKHILIPYVEIDADIKDSIHSVCLGPKISTDAGRAGLKFYLTNEHLIERPEEDHARGLQDVAILYSTAPLRSRD